MKTERTYTDINDYFRNAETHKMEEQPEEEPLTPEQELWLRYHYWEKQQEHLEELEQDMYR